MLTMLVSNAILFIGLIITCIVVREQPGDGGTGRGGGIASSEGPRPWPATCGGVVREYLEPFKDRNFFLVFFTRFLMQMGSSVIRFMQYWLDDKVTLPSGWSSEKALAVCMAPLLVTALISALVFGKLSDSLGQKRKIIIMGNGFLAAACTLALAFINNYWVILGITTLMGAGMGGFVSVDFALVMDVLPNQHDNAKAIALWHSALVIPQMTAVPLGGLIRDGFQHVGCGEECGLGKLLLHCAAARVPFSFLLAYPSSTTIRADRPHPAPRAARSLLFLFLLQATPHCSSSRRFTFSSALCWSIKSRAPLRFKRPSSDAVSCC